VCHWEAKGEPQLAVKSSTSVGSYLGEPSPSDRSLKSRAKSRLLRFDIRASGSAHVPNIDLYQVESDHRGYTPVSSSAEVMQKQ
jgi:hypothetical protein